MDLLCELAGLTLKGLWVASALSSCVPSGTYGLTAMFVGDSA